MAGNFRKDRKTVHMVLTPSGEHWTKYQRRPQMFAIMAMQRFLKYRSVSSTRILGIPSGGGPVISVNQSLLTVPFLTWKIYLTSCSGGPDFTPSLLHFITPSFHHTCTPSLPVRHLETCGEFRNETWRQWMLVGKFECNSYRKLMWTLPELHSTP